MKKSLLLLSAAAIALSGMAAQPKHKLQASRLQMDRSTQLQSFRDSRGAASPSRMQKAPGEIGNPDDIITSVEGDQISMKTIGTGYFPYNYYYLIPFSNDETAAHVVYGADNEVYLYNAITNAPSDSYIKGVKNGDKIEVSLPQTVYWFEGYDYGYALCLLEKDSELVEEGELWYNMKEEDASSVTFTVAEDGSIVAEGLSDDLLLGYVYTDDLFWSGYGVSDLTLMKFDGKAIEIPEDEVSKNFWTYNTGEYGWPVNWAQGYDECYLQGLCEDMPESWMKGSIAYDDDSATISIAQNQYLGVYGSYFIYSKCAKVVQDEDGYEMFELLPDDYVYELVWDFEENVISSKDPEVYLLFNASQTEVYALAYFADFKLVHQEDYAGTPANPTDLAFYDFMADSGYSAFIFSVPAVSTEGDVLMTENLSYAVYVNGEEWEFDADEYEIPETLEEIPWNFNGYWICYSGYTAIDREVDFFVEGIETLGVQSIYRYDGEETRSEIVTIDVENDPDAVGTIDADKKIADVKYYSIDGREVTAPAAGIFVKRVTFEDGSVATYKKAVR